MAFSRSNIFGNRVFICSTACLAFSIIPKAQSIKSVQRLTQVSLSYLGQARLSNKWGLWADLQLWTGDKFVNKFSQSITGLGLTYYINDLTRLTASYAFVNHYDAAKKVTQPEQRPWQQIQWYTMYRHKRMIQSIRLEERFRRKILNDSTLAVGYNFNYKIRYNIYYEMPLNKKTEAINNLSVVLSDDLHINFGRQIVQNYFDQNRFFAGVRYQFDRHNSMQLGYMNIFQQLAAGNKYRSTQVIRFLYYQNLDLRKRVTAKQA